VTDETPSAVRTQWTINRERLVDANPHIRLSVASVELPDGKQFEQYFSRVPRCAMTVVFDEPGERLLLIWRHKFIVDRWDWEVPGGYVDPGENGAAAAAREVEEETGWRPRSVEFLPAQNIRKPGDAARLDFPVPLQPGRSRLKAAVMSPRSHLRGQDLRRTLPRVRVLAGEPSQSSRDPPHRAAASRSTRSRIRSIRPRGAANWVMTPGSSSMPRANPAGLASRSSVFRCQGCSDVEKAILATTTP
jgi:8-oxo-dGTP pyrophosphatase MutT (NUDIX family)